MDIIGSWNRQKPNQILDHRTQIDKIECSGSLTKLQPNGYITQNIYKIATNAYTTQVPFDETMRPNLISRRKYVLKHFAQRAVRAHGKMFYYYMSTECYKCLACFKPMAPIN